MNRDYYNEYFEIERSHWWFKVRERIIKERLVSLVGSSQHFKLLNIGAATGRSSEMLSALEFDIECCEFTKSKLGIDMIHGTITDLPFASNYFDAVCAFDVIEHVKDHYLAVKEMKRVCKMVG